MSALLLLFDSCMRPGADSAVQATVCECVRTAAADPDWSKGLVTTLNDLHSAFDGVNAKSPGAALQSLPEASLLLLLHQQPVTVRRHEGTLHLSPEPRGPSKDQSAGQRGAVHDISLRLMYFLEALMRIAPTKIFAAVQGPALAFSELPPEVLTLSVAAELRMQAIITLGLISPISSHRFVVDSDIHPLCGWSCMRFFFNRLWFRTLTVASLWVTISVRCRSKRSRRAWSTRLWRFVWLRCAQELRLCQVCQAAQHRGRSGCSRC